MPGFVLRNRQEDMLEPLAGFEVQLRNGPNEIFSCLAGRVPYESNFVEGGPRKCSLIREQEAVARQSFA
jgi:hypothetical protein